MVVAITIFICNTELKTISKQIIILRSAQCALLAQNHTRRVDDNKFSAKKDALFALKLTMVFRMFR